MSLRPTAMYSMMQSLWASWQGQQGTRAKKGTAQPSTLRFSVMMQIIHLQPSHPPMIPSKTLTRLQQLQQLQLGSSPSPALAPGVSWSTAIQSH